MLFLVVLLASAHLVATCLPLYREALALAAAGEQAVTPSGREPLTASGLEAVLRQVIAYCDGASSSPQVMLPVTRGVAGAAVPAFTDDELQHLADVRQLFARGKAIRDAFSAVLLAVGILVARRTSAGLHQVSQAATRWAARWGIGFGVLVGAAAALDFSAAFTVFHLVLFDNDLWLLPADSLLIKMLPEWLFARLAVFLGVVHAVGLLALWLGVRFWKRFRRAARPLGT